MDHTFAVIMAGGVGSRFWPTSRAKQPKQFLDLTGSGQTMINGTVERVARSIPLERIVVVTGRAIEEDAAKLLPELPRENILAEPVGRNTSACIGWAAVQIARRDPEAILAVMPSDHLVADQVQFQQKMQLAVEQARTGALVTFGVTPTAPRTGFGYLELGGETAPSVHRVERFVEKPDRPTAEQYLKAGNFVWNSGMFFFRASRILDEIGGQLPELKAGLDEIEGAIGTGDEAAVLDRVYPQLPEESIDYGIMEGASDILCVPVSFGWSDLGSWAAAYERSEKDDRANAIEGDAITVNAEGNLVRVGTEKLVALVGVRNLVVVDTGDALMICARENAQDVKKVVTTLKKTDRRDLL